MESFSSIMYKSVHGRERINGFEPICDIRCGPARMLQGLPRKVAQKVTISGQICTEVL